MPLSGALDRRPSSRPTSDPEHRRFLRAGLGAARPGSEDQDQALTVHQLEWRGGQRKGGCPSLV
jgi:hypothetical protein